MKTVSIDLADKAPVAIPARRRSAAEVAKDVVKAGYVLITLKGLQRFHPRFRDDQPWDAVALPADSDAESLITAYDALLRMLAEQVRFVHRVYLIDGTFEMTGLVEPERVRLRVGEYREAFDATSSSGVQVTPDDYAALWHRIARCLEMAAAEVP
jgi:hypothetical protein